MSYLRILRELMAVREVVHLLPSEPISVLTTVIPMVAGIEFDVKGVFVSTVSTPAMAHLNSSIKGPLHT
jgi:hypothetical protein